jgi:polyisoprenoid-binding protein YceI
MRIEKFTPASAGTLLSCLLLALVATPIDAQTSEPHADARWIVDPSRSLAWWQVDPNYGHLWATTCPEDPGWQPGEGRSTEFRAHQKDPKISQSEVHSAKIPLWPRDSVQPICRRAVRGEFTTVDTRNWKQVHGAVRVMADSLTMGANMRDKFMHHAVLNTDTHPDLRFTIDSLILVQPGDTIHAVAVGTFEVHGTRHPVTAPAVAWHEGDNLRVQAQFGVSAKAMTEQYNMSRYALSMGVVLARWNTLHMGVDLFFRRAAQ